jgi:malonate decarboxylase epsilon subunit
MTLAFLFPGQGSQRPNMLSTLPKSRSSVAVLDEFHSWRACLDLPAEIDSPAALQDTTNVQVGLLIVGVGCARTLSEDYGLVPAFVAGHSVGAFAAAVTAGVLTFAEALAAVTLRGRLMQEACAGGAWGMAAITGLSTRAATQLTQHVSTGEDPVWVANVNGASQTVVSGTAAGLAKAAQAAQVAGATAYDLLDLSVASHCPLQAGTAHQLAVHLAQLPRRTPQARYLTNTRGRVVISAEVILDDLAQAVAQPVQWYDGTRLLPELGATCAIETPPGHVLTRLLPSTTAAFTALSVDDDGISTVTCRARRFSVVTDR